MLKLWRCCDVCWCTLATMRHCSKAELTHCISQVNRISVIHVIVHSSIALLSSILLIPFFLCNFRVTRIVNVFCYYLGPKLVTCSGITRYEVFAACLSLWCFHSHGYYRQHTKVCSYHLYICPLLTRYAFPLLPAVVTETSLRKSKSHCDWQSVCFGVDPPLGFMTRC
jgi:hypothetical protein